MVYHRLIEYPLPITKLNEVSRREVSFRRFARVPMIRNVHVWFARRPAGPSRVLTLASILPSNSDIRVLELKLNRIMKDQRRKNRAQRTLATSLRKFLESLR